MTTTHDAKRLPFRLLLYLVVPAVVSGLAVFAACFMVWYHIGGGAWRSWVSVEEAQLIERDKLSLIVNSCITPKVSVLNETGVDVQVRLHYYFIPLRSVGYPPNDVCEERVEIRLGEPLGNREVVDKHTGRLVSVTPGPGYGPVLTSPPPHEDSYRIDSPLRGTLVFDESTGCLYLESNSEYRYPVVWPAGASWQADPPAVEIHGQLIEPGMSVEGAGRYLRYDSIKIVAGDAVANAAYECADRSDPHKNIAFFNKGSRVDVVP